MNPLPRSTPAVALLAVALLVSASGGAVAGSLLTGKNIKDGSLTTKDVRDGTLRTADLSDAAIATLGGGGGGGATAYARIDGTAVTLQSGGVTASYADGRTCVRVPDVSSATTPALVNLDYAGDSTGTTVQAYAQLASTRSGCALGEYRVETFTRVSGGTRTPSMEPFFLLVP